MSVPTFKSSLEKVKWIIKKIDSGEDVHSIANELGYRTYKSLDMFMRREGYFKNKRLGNYIARNGEGVVLDTEHSRSKTTSDKATQVIKYFKEKEFTPKRIAAELGFENIKDMANYMKSKGFAWDSDRKNYVAEEQEETCEDLQEDTCEDAHLKLDEDMNLTKYLDILEYLNKRKKQLVELIESNAAKEANTIPRYVLPGICITKSLHITLKLDQTVKDFSAEKNISQKDIFEIALIDFFKRYGYKKTINTMLNEME